jgi:hypothetical protein
MEDSCGRTLPKRWRIAADAPSPPRYARFLRRHSHAMHAQGPEPPSRCAIRPLCTPLCPKYRHGVRFDLCAHRKAPNPVPVCDPALLHTARPRTPVPVCDPALLHTAMPETPSRCAIRPFCTPAVPELPSRCAIRPFCTPQFPKPRDGVRFAHFAHRDL